MNKLIIIKDALTTTTKTLRKKREGEGH